MIRRVPAAIVHKNLDALLSEVQCSKRRILITRGGKPVAALIDIGLLERLRKLDKEFAQLSGALAKTFAGAGPMEGEALVDEAVKAVRRKPPRK